MNAGVESRAEKARTGFLKELRAIKEVNVNVENIYTFSQDALSKLVALVERAITKYQNENGDKIFETKKELEEAAIKFCGITESVDDLLQNIADTVAEIDSLKSSQSADEMRVENVIIPTYAQHAPVIGSDAGFEEKKLVPRLFLLKYILKHDFNLSPDEYKIERGEVSAGMLRQEPYVRVHVPQLSRLLYLCDEEGNATFVFDTQKLQQLSLPEGFLDSDEKEQLEEFIEKNPGVGVRVRQQPQWRTVISEYLKHSLLRDHNTKKTYEFRERTPFPPFKSFVEEVRAHYTGAGDAHAWYQQERKNGKHWPANPWTVYKGDWVGWPELVGRENPKRKWPSLEDLMAEVRQAYQGRTDIQRWYKEEQKKHSNWNSNPNRLYKDAGWVDFYHLVGREDLRPDFASYEDFEAEVRASYPRGDVNQWYRGEYKKHPKWPAVPTQVYQRKWHEILGKEDPERHWPPFEEFAREVREKYAQAGAAELGVHQWYESVAEQNNWPKSPADVVKYKEDWQGWWHLVGKEHPRKRKMIPFDKFIEQVRALYSEEEGDVHSWYYRVYDAHKSSGWPSSPQQVYKRDGWNGWPALVGKENTREFTKRAFNELRKEVMQAYAEAVQKGPVPNIVLWYAEARKKEGRKWTSAPQRTYKETGFVSWRQLVGLEE